MTMTALVGALMALLPGAKTFDRIDKNIDKLGELGQQVYARVEQLEQENATLHRDLAVQRNLVEHWKGEARDAVRRARRDREAQERFATMRHLSDSAMLRGEQVLAQQAMQQQLGQQQSQGLFEGFCNCVPSRMQVFDAERQRIALNRQ